MNTTKKQKIAIITPYGGEERLDNYAEFNLAQGLIAKGWEVRMYTYSAKGIPTYDHDLTYKGIPIFRCPERLGVSPRLFSLLTSFQPDIVLGFHPRNFLNFSAYLAARFIGVRYAVQIVGILHDPYIVKDTDNPIGNLKDPRSVIVSFSQLTARLFTKDIYEGVIGKWKNYVLHMPTKNADQVIAINKDEMQYIQSVYGRKAMLAYWCAPQRSSGSTEQKPSVDLPKDFLFFIGQIKLRKGWDTAIDAIAVLKEKGIIKHLVFVTPHKDLREPIAYATKGGVREQIVFLSAVSNEERNWLYHHCQYVLIPSRYEGFGLPVFEAFLAEKPICATDIPTYLEFLVHKKNAMVSVIGDGAGLARSIQELDNDPSLGRALVEEGKKTLEDFSASHMVDSFLAAFKGA
jgi:glycosyltransferase involved in cell wall biosynthesis